MKRLLESPPGEESEAARLLRKLPPPDAPGDARARVWRKVRGAQGEPRRPPPAWVWTLRVSGVVALGVAAWMVLGALRGPLAVRPPAPTLALSSGAVERPSPRRVRTGPGSRALLRAGGVAVLLAEESEVEIAREAEVVLFRGRVAVAFAGGAPVVLRAPDGQVSGSGLFAGELRDSRRLERSEATAEERALLERFGRGAGVESRLRVEAPEGYEIAIDGTRVGPSPLLALLPPGRRALEARRGEGPPLVGEATVVEERETLHVLRQPSPGAGTAVEPADRSGAVPEAFAERDRRLADGSKTPAASSADRRDRHVPADRPLETADGSAAPAVAFADRRSRSSPADRAPEPAPSTAPLAHRRDRHAPADALAASGKGRVGAAAPEPEPGALLPPTASLAPRPSGAATAVDPDVEAYARAKELLAQEQAAEAVALFSQVARGRSSRAELSLYELGRAQLRHLRDPAAARAAFSSYVDRYPGGLLLQEVELSLIESELALSDLGAARASMERFLARHPESERRDEVLLLRANLDRDRGDCASALRRYRQLARGGGAIADDATYFAAACAQELGLTEEARALLQDSLQRFPAGRHADEARRALSGR